MQLRREEDRAACELLSAQPHWLDLPEAPHRGYESAAMLFDELLDTDDVRGELLKRVTELIQTIRPHVILSPVGIGNHVDHQQLVKVVAELKPRNPEITFFRWYDEPYLTRHPATWPADLAWQPALSWKKLQQQLARSELAVNVNIETAIDRKLAACTAYTTQLGFQFGGMQQLKAVFTKSGRYAFSELLRM